MENVTPEIQAVLDKHWPVMGLVNWLKSEGIEFASRLPNGMLQPVSVNTVLDAYIAHRTQQVIDACETTTN